MAIDGQQSALRAVGSTVTLSKATPSINVTKPGERQGVMRVDLAWSTKSKWLFLRSGPVAANLGCLYELSSGAIGVVQAGISPGALNAEPFIEFEGGQNLHIDLARPELFRRILIFDCRADDSHRTAGGVFTLSPTVGPRIEIQLDRHPKDARSCAIALLQNQGTGITVHREVHYLNGSHRALDETYHWGMRWDDESGTSVGG